MLLQKHSRGRFRKQDAKKMLRLAQTTVGITDPIWKYELQLLIPRLLELQVQIKGVKEKIHDFVYENFGNEVTGLLAVPGYSVISAAGVIAFVGDPKRFTGRRATNKLTAFAGLAVTQHSSGQKERLGRISKAGPSLLRYHLGWIGMRAVKIQGPVKEFYDKMVNRGKAKSLALVAVARKILRCSFYILRDGVAFDPNKLKRRSGLQTSVFVAS